MQRFYEAAGNGSWLLVPARACHTGFLDAGPLLNRVLDCLCCASCGRGMASRKVHSPVVMLDTLSTNTACLCKLFGRRPWQVHSFLLQTELATSQAAMAQLVRLLAVPLLKHFVCLEHAERLVRGLGRPAAAAPTAANRVGGAQDTLALTRPALLAWLERRLRPDAPTAANRVCDAQDTLALTRPALLAWLERRLRPDAPTAANRVCGAQDTLALTRPALLAWLERRLRPDAPGGEAAQLEFAGWLVGKP